MKRTTLTAAHKRTTSRIASKKHRRTLRYETLERRELLAVALAGVQSVGLWQMALDINHATNQGEILSQTAANFTLTGASGQAGRSVTVDWGDHSAAYHGTFNSSATAAAAHTFSSSGAFTVTVTCGTDVSLYRLQSSVIALGQVAGTERDRFVFHRRRRRDQAGVCQQGWRNAASLCHKPLLPAVHLKQHGSRHLRQPDRELWRRDARRQRHAAGVLLAGRRLRHVCRRRRQRHRPRRQRQ